MTSSPAWMPLYVADYLADTGHLSAAEHGAYMLLIMHYWRQRELPTDDRALARIARMNEDEWTSSRGVLAELFDPAWSPRKRFHFEHRNYRYVEAETRRRVLNESNGLCSYCQAEFARLEIDHVTPVSRGGSNAYDNLVAACRSCNASKRDLTPGEWGFACQ